MVIHVHDEQVAPINRTCDTGVRSDVHELRAVAHSDEVVTGFTRGTKLDWDGLVERGLAVRRNVSRRTVVVSALISSTC